MSSIVENLKEIAGSLPDGVKLVAVSKTKPVEAIEEAYKAGQRVFGENRVTLRGHADYAPRGEDIVCAAASALVFALIGALEEKGQLRELVIRPGLVTVAAEGDCRAEWQVIRCGLGQLAGKYPACVRLEA